MNRVCGTGSAQPGPRGTGRQPLANCRRLPANDHSPLPVPHWSPRLAPNLLPTPARHHLDSCSPLVYSIWVCLATGSRMSPALLLIHLLGPLLRLLARLTPRRRPHSFPIFRSGRFQTGLFRSRRPHPTPSPRPRTQPIQRRPAAPSQPQPSSPTRPKIRPKLSLASPPPLGAGWREIAPPSPPPDSRCPESRPQLRPIPATAGCRASASPPSNHAHPATAARRYTASDRQAPPRPNPRQNTPRAASRVFWKKLLLRARARDWRARRLAQPSTHSPQPDILNPPPVWAVICGGHTSS